MLFWDTSGHYMWFHKKLCARRILSYLKRYYLEGAAHQMERETTVFFDVSHLQYLASNSRWDELISYVTFFFKPLPGQQRSPQASTFLRCLDLYRALGRAASSDSASRLKDLALKCPELKGKLHLPRSHAPKHCQINLSGVRPSPRPFKKKANKQKARDIASFINQKRQEIATSLSSGKKQHQDV